MNSKGLIYVSKLLISLDFVE